MLPCENGIDLNADSEWGKTPVAFLAYDLDLLKCLIEYGADIECAVDLLYPLTEIAVEWVIKNNEPVALDVVDYKR